MGATVEVLTLVVVEVSLAETLLVKFVGTTMGTVVDRMTDVVFGAVVVEE